jgi:TolC family type I secretion outer membrane protein
LSLRGFLLALTVMVAATPVRAESLAEALRLAYESNPSLLEQRAAVRILDERYVQARAGFGPNATASASGQYQDAHTEQQSLFGGVDDTRNIGRTHTESLTLIQPFYTSGQVSSRVDEAEANVLAARASLRQAEAQLLQNVVISYLNVVRDRDLLRIQQETVAALEKERAATEARFEVRAVTRTDISQAEARLLASRLQLTQARGQLDVSESQYNQVVGHSPPDLTPPPALPNAPPDLDKALDQAELASPTLKQAQYTELASRAAIAEAKSAYGPQVAGRVDVSANPFLTYDSHLHERSVTAQVVLTQPLFAAGLNESRVREARNRNNRDRLDVENQRRGMIQSVVQAWSQLSTANATIQLARSQVEQEEAVYKGNSVEEGIGLRSTVETLNALQELQQARSLYTQLVHDQYAASAALLSAVGLLEIRYLDPGGPAYQPEKALTAVAGKGTPLWEKPAAFLDGFGRNKPRLDTTVRDAPRPTAPMASSYAEPGVTPAPSPPPN